MTKFQNNIYEKLDADAMQILIDYNLCQIPIDVFQLARKLNIKLIKFSSLTPKQLSAFVNQEVVTIRIYHSSSNYEIHTYYDDTLPLTRQRFNISHEIKHVIYEEWEYDDVQEKHANHFARSLLLHPALLVCLLSAEISELSNIFIISEESVSYALEAFDSRKEFFGKNLKELEKQFIKSFGDKTLFDDEVLKLNHII